MLEGSAEPPTRKFAYKPKENWDVLFTVKSYFGITRQGDQHHILNADAATNSFHVSRNWRPISIWQSDLVNCRSVGMFHQFHTLFLLHN